MKGRKPKPRSLKVLHGNPGGRPLPEKIDCPTDNEVPAPPEGLSKTAQKEWARIAKLLHGVGLLSKIDTSALEAYCVIYARWKEAEQKITKFGMVVKNARGLPTLSPYLKIADHCIDQMKAYLVEFGMTPSSRTRVKSEKKQQSTSWRDKLKSSNA